MEHDIEELILAIKQDETYQAYQKASEQLNQIRDLITNYTTTKEAYLKGQGSKEQAQKASDELFAHPLYQDYIAKKQAWQKVLDEINERLFGWVETCAS